jgi:thioredoxin 1
MIAPVLDQLGGEYEGKAAIAKVNVDEAADLAQEFSVQSIPTLLIMKDGQEVNRFIGVTSKGELAAALDSAIA